MLGRQENNVVTSNFSTFTFDNGTCNNNFKSPVAGSFYATESGIWPFLNSIWFWLIKEAKLKLHLYARQKCTCCALN